MTQILSFRVLFFIHIFFSEMHCCIGFQQIWKVKEGNGICFGSGQFLKIGKKSCKVLKNNEKLSNILISKYW